ncbi:hypothetical protein ADIS_2249 [Lunatimonas lonarensis]|uniref:Uncharacterized protein n=1 Tax=Lunatimonas lonarensis TaxID=1232681 RepID=R7ZTA2_9BACT|nr:hypothetical protein ADIS_2249 [Lunatimonas lonarensis]
MRLRKIVCKTLHWPLNQHATKTTILFVDVTEIPTVTIVKRRRQV